VEYGRGDAKLGEGRGAKHRLKLGNTNAATLFHSVIPIFNEEINSKVGLPAVF